METLHELRKKSLLLILAAVILIGVIGGTYAYYTTNQTFNNDFTTGIYSTTVTETFESPSDWLPGDVTTKAVNVTNNGNVTVAVRASLTESWTAADGTTVLDGTRDGENLALFEVKSGWNEATDGYYYYNATLAPGETSTNFIDSVTFNPNFSLEEGLDYECTDTNDGNGNITTSCKNLSTGYSGATYKLSIKIETVQADQVWDYTKVYAQGDVITIENETFYVISDNGDNVKMLSAYGLGTDYKQSTTTNNVKFSDANGWEYAPAPKEIDIQAYDGSAKTYINEYVTYLQEETGDTTLSGNLITLTELKDLGCTIDDNYSSTTGAKCTSSKYADWLVNGQYWWTRSANSLNGVGVWIVSSNGSLIENFYTSKYGMIRPVITISKETLKKL